MIDEIRNFVNEIGIIGAARSPDTIKRRLSKALEEIGELSEANLGVTCVWNYKNKTIAHIREESLDCLIVLVDCALTSMPSSLYCADAFLPQIIDESRKTTIGLDDIPDLLLDVAGAVSRANTALKENHQMGYYGSLTNAIRAMAGLCFAPLDANEKFAADNLFALAGMKFDKWRNALNNIERVKLHEAV